MTTAMTDDLRAAYRDLLNAALSLREAGDRIAEPPEGEWNGEQILAHVSILTAVTIAAVSAIAAGTHATYDNRVSQDAWTIDHVVELTADNSGLCDRIRVQAEVLCALAESALSDAELDTPVPTRLVSHNALLVDQPVPLRDLIAGLAANEIPGHTKQLNALQQRRA